MFSETVYYIGRVLGDRNVLYKDVNPNLLAVMAQRTRPEEKIDVVTLYLVDVVAGRIIHSRVHRRASGPVSLVVSENWVLVSLSCTLVVPIMTISLPINLRLSIF